MRLYRGLRGDPLPQYDVVVIGAGIGGLFSANLLAANGLRTLLVEQHYMAGGYCSSFRRKGYTFDAATHFYPLLGNPSTAPGKLLRDLQIAQKWVKMDPVDTFHLPDSTRFEVPAEFDRYIARLREMFPEERGALERFFSEVRERYLHGSLRYLRWRDSKKIHLFAAESVTEALDRHFRSRKLKLLLTADCAHWGSPPDRTSFVFDSMLRLSYFLGNYYPEGGSQAFADRLAQRFEQLGGHILMSSRVERIRVDRGQARGVDLLTGFRGARHRVEVKSNAVISNADLSLTFESLLGPRHVPDKVLRKIRALRPSYPCYLTHIGLEGVPISFLDQIQGYYWDSWDPDEVGRDGLRFKLFCPSVYEPAVAAPGRQVLIVQKVRAVDSARVEDWQEHKREYEQWVDEKLELTVPGLRDHIVVKLTATARTAEHFTLNRGGSMLGWEMAPDQLGQQRPGLEGPVRNLFLVGHWTQPGGGIVPVIVSAVRAAHLVTGASRASSLDGSSPSLAP